MNWYDTLLTAGPIAWALVVRYHPKWKSVPNLVIPWITTIAAFITKLVPQADAATLTVAGVLPLVKTQAAGLGAVVVSSAWIAAQNWLLSKVFVHSVAEHVFNLKRNDASQRP